MRSVFSLDNIETSIVFEATSPYCYKGRLPYYCSILLLKLCTTRSNVFVLFVSGVHGD